MGVDAEDVTGDGLPELLVTHFREDYDTLYRNLDGRNFQDISSWAGIVKDSMPNVGWGCALADLDGDGWPDILTVNGHVDDNLEQARYGCAEAEPAKVWRNQGTVDSAWFRTPARFSPRVTLRVARPSAISTTTAPSTRSSASWTDIPRFFTTNRRVDRGSAWSF